MTGRRRLSDEERALWSGVVRSITPLRRGNSSPGSPSVPLQAPAPPAKPIGKPAFKDRNRPQPLPPADSPPLAPLGRRLKQRVARGREPIEARIDLHGMTQSEAHAALLDFLRRARADGARIALVVTGKGVGRGGDSASGIERGVLKRQVPNWFSLPEFRSLIVGFESAHVGHGGQGALYVRLRRPR
ncbi:MAG: Smr/MutS family protein [Xanthobacteraceae bacterium]